MQLLPSSCVLGNKPIRWLRVRISGNWENLKKRGNVWAGTNKRRQVNGLGGQ